MVLLLMSITVTIKRRSLVMIAFLVIGLIVTGTILTLYKNKIYAQENSVAIQTALIQNVLILDAGLTIDLGSPGSVEEHRTISASLKQNHEKLEQLSIKADDNLSSRIHKLVEAEKLVLTSYDSKFAALKKALEYNPADDIGTLNLGSHKGELLSRVVGSKKGMETIHSQISKPSGEVDERSRQLLAASINCFSNLETVIQTAPDDQITGARQQCIDAFSKTKMALNQDLIATLNNETMKKQRNKVDALLKTLASTTD